MTSYQCISEAQRRLGHIVDPAKHGIFAMLFFDLDHDLFDGALFRLGFGIAEKARLLIAFACGRETAQTEV